MNDQNSNVAAKEAEFLPDTTSVEVNAVSTGSMTHGVEPVQGPRITEFFMRAALKQAQLALQNGEIPVGCVFVDTTTNQIISAGHNKTNETRNGTSHAEINAINELVLERHFNPADFARCELYVTCEPCIMCAAALAKLNIARVYFGCSNDRFGGNGSILHVHSDAQRYGLHRYPIEKGLLEKETIEIFQTFYTTENRRAPEGTRKKKRNLQSPEPEPAKLQAACVVVDNLQLPSTKEDLIVER
jgi:tRNA-specific adenosine deaminase 2